MQTDGVPPGYLLYPLSTSCALIRAALTLWLIILGRFQCRLPRQSGWSLLYVGITLNTQPLRPNQRAFDNIPLTPQTRGERTQPKGLQHWCFLHPTPSIHTLSHLFCLSLFLVVDQLLSRSCLEIILSRHPQRIRPACEDGIVERCMVKPKEGEKSFFGCYLVWMCITTHLRTVAPVGKFYCPVCWTTFSRKVISRSRSEAQLPTSPRS